MNDSFLGTFQTPVPISGHKFTFNLQKPPKAAEGYPDDARMLFTRTSVADFIMGGDHLTQLAATNQLLFDKPSEVFAKHPSTTADIRQLCEDVKVLGPRELKQLVKWRAAMRTFLEEVGSDGEEKEGDKVEVKKDDLSRADARVGELLVEEAAEAKRFNSPSPPLSLYFVFSARGGSACFLLSVMTKMTH